MIATHDGRDMLVGVSAARSREQRYAPLEIVVVDGGSSRRDRARCCIAEHPSVVLVAANGNPGFAAACNLGVAAASGEFLLLLNNDTTLEPDAIGQLVRVALQSPARLAAVNAMTRRADLPAVVDSLGNVSGMRGFGAPRYAGFVDFGQFARDGELFSASFTAVLIPRRAWELVGPLDERYGYYYEDVDWSLRARMGGLYVLPAPHSLVYHEGSASIGARPSAYKLRLVTRNRVLWAGKVLRMRNSLGFARRYALEDADRISPRAARGPPRRCGRRSRPHGSTWPSALPRSTPRGSRCGSGTSYRTRTCSAPLRRGRRCSTGRCRASTAGACAATTCTSSTRSAA